MTDDLITMDWTGMGNWEHNRFMWRAYYTPDGSVGWERVDIGPLRFESKTLK